MGSEAGVEEGASHPCNLGNFKIMLRPIGRGIIQPRVVLPLRKLQNPYVDVWIVIATNKDRVGITGKFFFFECISHSKKGIVPRAYRAAAFAAVSKRIVA